MPSAVCLHFFLQVAAIDYEDSESEESSEGGEGNIDKEDPLWSLFGAIRYFKTTGGSPIAEPFLTLPSKRELPDYYKTIDNPISLNIVRKKLKNNEYSDTEGLFEDMNLMFENCKKYNRPDSRLFKDAVKLVSFCYFHTHSVEIMEEIHRLSFWFEKNFVKTLRFCKNKLSY